MRGEAQIVPILLAAGASGGLEFPKALAKFGARTALEIAIQNCAGLAAPVVVLGSDADLVRRAVPEGVRVIINENWRAGQMSSLRAALAEIAPDAHVMLYPVDYPLLTRDVVQKLAAGFHARSPGQSIAIPRYRKRGGHPVIFAANLRHELEQAKTARDVVYRDARRAKFVNVRTEAIWRDLDSPAAYRARMREFKRRARSPKSEGARSPSDPAGTHG